MRLLQLLHRLSKKFAIFNCMPYPSCVDIRALHWMVWMDGQRTLTAHSPKQRCAVKTTTAPEASAKQQQHPIAPSHMCPSINSLDLIEFPLSHPSERNTAGWAAANECTSAPGKASRISCGQYTILYYT